MQKVNSCMKLHETIPNRTSHLLQKKYVLVSFLPFFPLSRFPPHTLHVPRDSDLYTKCFPNSELKVT